MSFKLELLDVQQGLPVQAWTLTSGKVWQIGRAEDADIVIPHPFVSRAHAYLRETDGGWELIGISDKGVLVDGERRAVTVLHDGSQFQLAARGPLLQFRASGPCEDADGEDSRTTYCLDEESLPLLVIDRERRDEEVQQIVENEAFEEIRRKAAEIQQRRRVRP
jgi:pSer/pThr/pTyr-binding forkhead associated (FHA) protein